MKRFVSVPGGVALAAIETVPGLLPYDWPVAAFAGSDTQLSRALRQNHRIVGKCT